MQYNVTSRGVGARQCRAPTGVPHVNDNCYNRLPNRNFNFSFADLEQVGFIFI
ncbi:MAG: hypothetical protein V7K50_17810 [Nostoc sp.]|uniref:hypothetical protein n=1 Tax=Nostoc sp. TaxID=1180 RepID=UPI002FF54019